MSTHTIRIVGSDTPYTCPDEDTLLRAALRQGLGFPYECNVGSCGNCKFELIEGEVKMAWPEAPGWRDKDREKNRYLGCQAHAVGNCVIKLNPAPKYVPLHPPRRIAAQLKATRKINHDISEFSFELSEAMSFEPGQYALLYMPGLEGARAYSMSNTAMSHSGGSKVWEFQVRRTPTGQGTAVLFDQLKVGSSVELDGPYGMAYLRRDVPRDILCIAGGSGLAPMISIARGAMVEPALKDRQLHFFYGARTAQDICGQDMLQTLPGWGTRLHYQAALSNPELDTSGTPWSGPVGFVHEAVQKVFADQLPQMEIYFAGPPPMAMAVQRMLLQSKVPFSQVHFDQFY
jgi:toluene monooxygenase electron transfer component